MEIKSQPPYEINKTESALYWKTEHSISYAPLKIREKRELTNKNQIRKIQITYPFSFSKV